MTRSRPYRGLWIAVGAVAVLVLVGIGVHQRRIQLAWREMIVRGDRLEARLANLDDQRPVLWGTSQAGNAWEDYARAVAALAGKDVANRWRLTRSALSTGDLEAARQVRLALHADCADVLEALRLGAHRARAPRAVKWGAVVPHSLLEMRHIANLAVIAARCVAEQGDGVKAAHHLLDAMQLGRDLLTSPALIEEMIGGAILAIATKEALVHEGVLDGLAAPGLTALQDGMRQLDDTLAPVGYGQHGDLLWAIRTATGPDGDDMFGPALMGPGSPAWRAWRYGFSPRLMCADHVEFMERALQRMHAAAAQPWPARRAVLADVQRSFELSPNPMSRVLAPSLESVATNRLQCIAHLRLARALVAYRLDGEVLRLPDPFGDHLGYRVLDDELQLWSAGPGSALRVSVTRNPVASPR